MIGVRRMDHVCMAVWSVDEQLPFLRDVIGMEVTAHFRVERERYAGVTLSVPGGGIEFELIEPIDDESFVAKFLRERGPGLHHITLEVEDAAAAAADMHSHDIEPYMGVRGREGQRETFIHPRDSGGVLFQLIEQHRTYGPKQPGAAAETASGE